MNLHAHVVDAHQVLIKKVAQAIITWAPKVSTTMAFESFLEVLGNCFTYFGARGRVLDCMMLQTHLENWLAGPAPGLVFKIRN